MFSTEFVFRPTLSVINEAQIEQLHQATLELLERTGIEISHARALEPVSYTHLTLPTMSTTW